MADFGLFDIAASLAWEKGEGTAQVLQAEGLDGIPDCREVEKADSATRGSQSAVGLHHHGGSDGEQEWENMPAPI